MKGQEVIVHKKARRPIKNQDCENQTSFSVHDGPSDFINTTDGKHWDEI